MTVTPAAPHIVSIFRLSFKLFAYLAVSGGLFAQTHSATIITGDVDRFWQAYDRIVATPDSAAQIALLQEYYLDHATPGSLAVRILIVEDEPLIAEDLRGHLEELGYSVVGN